VEESERGAITTGLSPYIKGMRATCSFNKFSTSSITTTTSSSTNSSTARRLRNIAVERYLSRRPHSSYEVQTKLRRLRERPSLSVIQEAVNALTKDKLLDDTSFATFFTASRIEHRSRSKRELIHELRVKGVDAETITKTISASLHDEDVACEKAASKKPRSTDKELRTYLLRKGFDFSTINQIIIKRKNESILEASTQGVTLLK